MVRVLSERRGSAFFSQASVLVTATEEAYKTYQSVNELLNKIEAMRQNIPGRDVDYNEADVVLKQCMRRMDTALASIPVDSNIKVPSRTRSI